MWTCQHLVDADDVNLSDKNIDTRLITTECLLDGSKEVGQEVNSEN